MTPTDNTGETANTAEAIGAEDKRLAVFMRVAFYAGRYCIRVSAFGSLMDNDDNLAVWQYGLRRPDDKSLEYKPGLLIAVEDAVTRYDAVITVENGSMLLVQSKLRRLPQVWIAVRKAIKAARENAGYASVTFM